MGFLDDIKKKLDEAKTQQEREKILKESDNTALWTIANLLDKAQPPEEKVSYNQIDIGSTLVTDQQVSAAGNFIAYQAYVQDTSNYANIFQSHSPIQIRINSLGSPIIYLFPGDTLRAPFTRFYFTKQWHIPGYKPVLFYGYNLALNSQRTDFPFSDSANPEIGKPALIDINRRVQVDINSLPALPSGSNIIGSVYTLNSKTLLSAAISVAASGDNTIITNAANSVYIYALAFNVAGTVNVILKDSVPTILTGAFQFQTREGLTLGVSPPSYLFKLTAAKNFVINLSQAIGIYGWVSYWVE